MMKNLLTGVSEVQADLVRVSFVFVVLQERERGYEVVQL